VGGQRGEHEQREDHVNKEKSLHGFVSS